MECPHCDNDIEEVKRTGEKRYACGSCSMVIAFDDLNPHLDDLNVIDKRKESQTVASNNENGGTDSQKDSAEQSSQSEEPSPDEEAPVINSNSNKSDREIIREEGYEGLKRIKEDKLKQWLATTDGVGSKTENRILMVFRNEDMYSKEPNTLYNLLDDELNASPSYINTIVNSVFAPEYEHEDLLQNQGYTPFYLSSGQGGGNRSQGGSRGGNSMGNNFNNSNQGQQQGGGQPPQPSPGGSGGGSDDLSREEALEMIKTMSDSESSGSRRRGPGTEALDEATEQAIKNMADNMGGFFGMLQRVGEEALITYFRENPEKLVENMTLLNTFMESNNEQGNDKQPAQEDQKIDNAIEQAQAASQSGGGGASEPVDSNSAFRTPGDGNNEPSSSEPEHNSDDSGFEMDPDVMEGGGSTQETDVDRGVDSEDPMAASPSDTKPETQTNDSSRDNISDSGSSNEVETEPAEELGPARERDEDEEWDELFGDLED